MSQFTDDEPIITTAVAGAIVAYVAGLLVTHGVITSTHASAVTQQVVPLVASVLTLALGVIARRFVTPAKKVEHLLATSGLMSDADFSRVEAIISDALDKVGVRIPMSFPSVSTGTTTMAPSVITYTTNLGTTIPAGPSTETPPVEPETPPPA